MNRPVGSTFLLSTFLALGFLALLPHQASAATYTWRGQTNNSWAVSSGNWYSPSGVGYPGSFPTTTDIAEFGPSAPFFVVVEDFNITVDSVVFNASSYVLYLHTGALGVTNGISATTANAARVTVNSSLSLGGASTIATLAGVGSLSTTGSGPATLDIVGSGTTFSGRLTESSGSLSIFIGDGTNAASQTFSGTADYSGATTVRAGATLAVGSDHALSVNSAHVIDGTLNLATGSSTIGALSGSGVVNLNTNGLTVVGGGMFSGTLTGAGGYLTKAGGGILTLSGVGSYTGPTFVDSGTLQLDGDLSGDVTVRSGATLTGSGAMENLVLESGAILIPVDCLDAETLTWNPDAGIVFDLDEFTIIELAGDFLRGGLSGFEFTFLGYGDLGLPVVPLIVFNGDTDFLVSDFTYSGPAGLEGFFTLDEGALSFTITAVPEPATLAFLLLGAAPLLRRRPRSPRPASGAIATPVL